MDRINKRGLQGRQQSHEFSFARDLSGCIFSVDASPGVNAVGFVLWDFQPHFAHHVYSHTNQTPTWEPCPKLPSFLGLSFLELCQDFALTEYAGTCLLAWQAIAAT